MEIDYYVAKAALALKVPDEMRQHWIHFSYDPCQEEWRFGGYLIKGKKPLADVMEWVNRMCAWLQCRYPLGPVCPEECCC